MLKIDRSAVDKAIEGLEMFTATKEVLADYEAEKKVLGDREEVLADRLAELQEQHVTLLMDRETAKDNPSDYIYLSTQLTKTDEEVKILLSLQEQQNEDFAELKKKYMPLIRETYSQDTLKRNSFNVNAAMAIVRDELRQVISDYESEIHKQDRQVMPVIFEDFLSDSDLMNESWDDVDRRRNALAFKRIFDFDRNNLHYDRSIKL